MSKKRKTYSAAEKAKIVLEVLREESTLNEIATNYGVSPQLISRWKIEFLENMPGVFDKKNTEIEQLKKEHFSEKEDLKKEGTYRVRQSEDYGQTPVQTFGFTSFIGLLQESCCNRTESGRSSNQECHRQDPL